MGGESEEQKLQEITLAEDHNVQLPVVDESWRSALQRTKCSLDLMVPECLFLGCTKR